LSTSGRRGVGGLPQGGDYPGIDYSPSRPTTVQAPVAIPGNLYPGSYSQPASVRGSPLGFRRTSGATGRPVGTRSSNSSPLHFMNAGGSSAVGDVYGHHSSAFASVTASNMPGGSYYDDGRVGSPLRGNFDSGMDVRGRQPPPMTSGHSHRSSRTATRSSSSSTRNYHSLDREGLHDREFMPIRDRSSDRGGYGQDMVGGLGPPTHSTGPGTSGMGMPVSAAGRARER
jgi:hypothetical protein